jgi:DNA replication and repair protein RecF
VKVRSLEIQAFRNLSRVELRPSPGLNGFWGPNAQGKTNVLEALFAALRGKSFRPYSSKSDWVPKGSETSQEAARTRVAIGLEDKRGFTTDVVLSQSPAGKWDLSFNGKRSLPSAVRSKIAVVVFSPDDHGLVREGPEQRRDYLDELFTDVCPGYAEVLGRFEKALKSRNSLLRREIIPEAELRTWSHMLAEAATQLSQLRREIWPEFRRIFLGIASDLFAGFTGPLEVELVADVPGAPTVEVFLEAFQKGLEVDKATGWTHRGPQRDDFSVRLGGSDARTTFSQGQARLLALSLKWTHAEWVRSQRGEPPIFLLDDFSSELDARRRELLLQQIRGLSGQIFVTGTDPSLVDSAGISEYTFFHVFAGVLTPA